jgi:hypothetical protein
MRKIQLLTFIAVTMLACGVPETLVPVDGGARPMADSTAELKATDSPSMQACATDQGSANPDVQPTGTRLQAGDALSVRGITTDGYVIFSDDAALELYAIPLTGGSAQSLGSLGGKYWVTVIGTIVFSWSNVTASGGGSLSTWSASTGLKPIASASYGLLAAVSADETQILYVDKLDATGTTGDVSMANVGGSNAATLVAGAYVAGCFPQFGFVGSYVLTSHCDGSPGPAFASTISSFSLPGAVRTDLVTHAANYWSTSGTQVLTSTAGGVILVPMGGGTPETVDTTGFIGLLSTDGSTAFYSTISHGFRRSPSASPSPVTLVPSDFGGLYSLSDDDNWAMYYWTMGMHGSDLYLAATNAPTAPATLSSSTSAGLVGDPFTGDSSHALYVTNVDPCTDAGDFHARTVDGTSDTVLGHEVWLDSALGNTQVIFNDNYVSTGGSRSGRADIELADTSTQATPTRLVSRADAVFEATPSHDQVVYSWSLRPGSSAGLYLVRLP